MKTTYSGRLPSITGELCKPEAVLGFIAEPAEINGRKGSMRKTHVHDGVEYVVVACLACLTEWCWGCQPK